MGTIFYSVSGEGRGHATRVKAMVDELCGKHRVVIYAPDMAYDFLSQAYQKTDVQVRRIPGLSFHYTAYRHLNPVKTLWQNAVNAIGFPGVIQRIQRDIESECPDVAITDFEPLLPRAAQRCGLPFISLDHQHFLLTYDLSSLPRWLRMIAALMSGVVGAYYDGQAQTIVSSFYFPPLRPECQNVEQIGVLLRPEILQAKSARGEHVVAYLRRSVPMNVYDALTECGCDVHVYGLGPRSAYKSLQFFEVDAYRFVQDLAASRALISTAGNQLVGEALYLGKPVLAMPERGNYEQHINAHFLEQCGGGMACSMEKFSGLVARRFLKTFREPLASVNPARLYGNPAALNIIERYLPPSRSTLQTTAHLERPLSNIEGERRKRFAPAVHFRQKTFRPTGNVSGVTA
ncbi:teichoic acid biosynthesis related protein [Candidatus Moduliflexus flocculans]|uniref:Teichoic acid biosynthesis related protein n=1 Tax=Candidatus Moduliflexus flocculans TaxID=1499966 RepID=A0A0S6VTN0_9BACT|nr:teichoic acid biosynthesis related protein [Candidatus Moduliflexus flocculans]